VSVPFFLTAAAGLLGALIGSFLNVVVYRLPRGESLVSPGSHCPSCDAGVAPWDNVPVLSYLVLRGRCRRCKAHISARYPVVELVTALAFAAVVATGGLDADLVLELPFVALLIAVAGVDIDHRIVPNRLVAPAAVSALALTPVVSLDRVPEMLIAAAAAFSFLLLAALAYPGGMGMGDVKLAGVMGLFLGIAVIPALLVAFAAGSVVGVAMVVRHGAAARKRGVPFAPFLALGGFVALLVGPELLAFYGERFLGG
jgi:leader peptidase (prepilin peptidase)/N-methyltransferase